jgi:hypothetical protein
MLLLVGPPGSGKTEYCLNLVRQSHATTRLLVPTATMGEHLRNHLAREGLVFRPSTISTFSKFLEPYTQAVEEVTPAALELIVREVLQKSTPKGYEKVAEFKGFLRTLSSAIEEYSAAGGTAQTLSETDPDFAAAFQLVNTEIKRRGWQLRGARMKQAAARIREEKPTGSFLLTGFFSFTRPELAVVEALAETCDLTVALPEWTGSEPALAVLRPLAREIREMPLTQRATRRALVAASTIDGEVTEIARRIHAQREAGRPYREVGVILRTETPYGPALRSAFDRFGIPARFYFGDPLAQQPAIRYLTALADAALSGWDHELTLKALHLPGSPIEQDGDKFDYKVREQLPNRGLGILLKFADGAADAYFADLDKLSTWRSMTALPRTWAVQLREMASLFHVRPVRDMVAQQTAQLWRADANALKYWDASVEETATALDPSVRVSCADFVEALKLVLHAATLRTPDHRRDVVHVIDAFEARQWRLPVVFVCGLVEKQFPRYHTDNPVLNDEARRKLQRFGVELRTSGERQADEQFLFDLCLTRGTEQVTLTYPVLNGKYDANLPSFLLERARPFVEEPTVEVRPKPKRPRGAELHPFIYSEELQEALRSRHQRISATSIESYLQCPYQFFAQRTLKLQEPPEGPFDRLNLLVQGEIGHTVLDRAFREARPVVDVFDEEWQKSCVKARIPASYRTEAVRLELLTNLELLAADPRLAPGDRTLYEERFEVPLENCVISGRIDRVEIDADGSAYVIDYKYRVESGIASTKKGHAEGTHVQGGLYLHALSRLGDYQPRGMVYCGFKRAVSFGGWMATPFESRVGQKCSDDDLRQVMSSAMELSQQATVDILNGKIAPEPADEKRCERCTYTQICRVETVKMKRAVGGGGVANAAQ